MAKVNILCVDIETVPNVVTTFVLRKANIRHQSIIENTAIFCASWQTLDQMGDPKTGIKSVSIMDDSKRFNKNIYDDAHVVKELHKALDEADILLGQNSRSFDLKVFNGRAIYHRLPPIGNKPHIDTYRDLKNVARLDSFKLDFQGRYFGTGKKIDVGGMELWDNIVQYKYPPVGQKPDKELMLKSIKEAIRYNKQDVRLTVENFKVIRPYIKLPNFALHLGKVVSCTYCGGQNLRKNGYRYTMSNKYTRYWCRDCKRPVDPPRTQGRFIDGEFNE